MKDLATPVRRSSRWGLPLLLLLVTLAPGILPGCKHFRDESHQMGWTLRVLSNQSHWWKSLSSDTAELLDPELDAMGETVDLFLESSSARF